MTQLLVSVRNAAEAIAALEGGADWIDVKEPSRGSLGAADASTIDEVLRVVDGRVPVSAAFGELVDEPPGLSRRDKPAGSSNYIRLAKCGLAGSGNNWQQSWLHWTSALPPSCGAVLVAYAEESRANAPSLKDIVSFAIEVRPAAVLIDTAIKDHQTLLDHFDVAKLNPLLGSLRKNDIPFALAGSLKLDSVPSFLSLAPGWLAVRGAVCDDGRNGVVSAEKVRQWKDAILYHQARLVGKLD